MAHPARPQSPSGSGFETIRDTSQSRDMTRESHASGSRQADPRVRPPSVSRLLRRRDVTDGLQTCHVLRDNRIGQAQCVANRREIYRPGRSQHSANSQSDRGVNLVVKLGVRLVAPGTVSRHRWLPKPTAATCTWPPCRAHRQSKHLPLSTPTRGRRQTTAAPKESRHKRQ